MTTTARVLAPDPATAPRPATRRRWTGWLLAALIAAGGGWLVLQALHDPPPAEPVATAAPPRVAIAKGKIDVEGGVIRLAAMRDGVVARVFVEEGDRVEAGRVLAQLDDREARLNAEVARRAALEARAQVPVYAARLRAAEREQRRMAALVPTQAASRARLEQAEDEVAVRSAELASVEAAAATAEARERAAAYEVELRAIRAPLAGVVVRRQARPGDGVSTLNVTPLFTFAPDTPRIVRAELDEQFVGRVRPGMRAEVVPEADESRRLQAEVIRLGRVFGAREPSDDPTEPVDQRVVEMVLSLEPADLLIGQRVLVEVKG